MSKPPSEGGQRAVEIDFQDEVRQQKEHFTEQGIHDMNVVQAANEDYAATAWAIKKMSLRKSAPPWSVPTEVWRALFYPNWYWRPGRVAAIGIEDEKLKG